MDPIPPTVDSYRPRNRTYETSISPPPAQEPPRRELRSSSPTRLHDIYRGDHRSPRSTGAPASTRRRDSSPRPLARDFRGRREDDLFYDHWEPADAHDDRSPVQREPDHWDPREPLSAPGAHNDRGLSRSSPVKRKVPRSNEWHSSPQSPPPPHRPNETHFHEDSPPSADASKQHQTHFRNLSWTKPRELPYQPAATSATVQEKGSGEGLSANTEKAEVNGIKDVPTGPAQKGGLPVVPDFIRKLPHLFISSRFVPALLTTTPHLARLVQRHGTIDVIGDDTGYFITFANNDEGRTKLQQCFQAHKGDKLFGQYRLIMRRFSYGQASDQNGDDGMVPRASATAVTTNVQSCARASSPIQDDMQTAPSFDGQTHMSEQDHTEPNKGIEQTVSTPLMASNSALPPSHDLAQSPPRRHLPHPAQPFSPHDSTSSMSVQAASDISSMGHRRCHVCKVKSDAAILVNCSTCSRRYHRHCHTTKSIPVVPGNDWQCQRCERKKVPLNRRVLGPLRMPLNGKATGAAAMEDGSSSRLDATEMPVDGKEAASAEMLNDEAPILGSSEMPINSTAAMPDDHGRGSNELGEEESLDHVQTTLQTQEPNHVEPAANQQIGSTAQQPADDAGTHSAEPTADSMIDYEDPGQQYGQPANSDDPQFTELQDLVEKSFTASASSSRSDQPKKRPLKLILTKRKRSELDERNGMPQRDPNPPSLHLGKQSGFNNPELDAPAPDHPSGLHRTQVSDSCAERPGIEAAIPDLRGSHASASPVDSVVQVNKFTKKSKPQMVRCIDCGNRTPKPPFGPGSTGLARCTQCKKKVAEKAAEGPLPGVAKQSPLQTTREDRNDIVISLLADEESPQSPLRTRPPSQAENERPDAQDALMPPAVEPQRSETHNCDVEMADDDGRSEDDDDSLFGDTDMVDHIEGLPAASQPSAMSQESTAATSAAPTSKRKTGFKRKSQCSVPTDKNDLGNWDRRPKGTYRRLIAMALCDTPGNALQPHEVVEWISRNVPGYENKEKEGSWAEGIKSTMIMNVQGRSGAILATRIKWKQGDDGEEGKDWYQLLPGMKERLEHWDRTLQRPVSPATFGQPQNIARMVNDIASYSDSDEQDQPLASFRQGKLKPVQTGGRKHVTKSTSMDMHDAMDVDDAEHRIARGTPDPGSSEEEPLASTSAKRKQHIAQQRNTASLLSPAGRTPSKNHPPVSDSTPLAAPTRVSNVAKLSTRAAALTVGDDLMVREFIKEEVANRKFTAKNLDEWPEYLATNQVNREEEKLEIMKRPTRKQLFKKPAHISSLHDPNGNTRPPPTAPPLVVAKDAHRFLDVGKDSQEYDKPCETLDEFLGVPEDVEYEPCIVERHLAFRVPGARVSNKTDIRIQWL